MYSKHIIYLFIVGVIFFLLFGFMLDTNISESLMQNFITFLSITFGFYMTSLSVLYNSKYIKNLYEEIDKDKPVQRKIHTLKAYFKGSAYWSLFSIGILILYSLLIEVKNNILVIDPLVESMLITIVFINFIFMFLLFKVFINGLIEEGKNNA